jgi:hypothetical protein
MHDDNIDWSYAGPGHKRKQQEENARRRREAKPEIVREYLPEKTTPRAKQSSKREEKSTEDIDGRNARRLIGLLALKLANARLIEIELQERGLSISLLTVSNIRSQFLADIKILKQEGLMDDAALRAYRED